MYIKNISQNSFKASFSQDSITQNLLKQGIESNPYDVYEAEKFLNILTNKDVFSLSSKETKDGEKFFIQRNNEKAVEINSRFKTGKASIINVLKELSYTIAQGGNQFKAIFGSKAEPIGDFAFHITQAIETFLNGANVDIYYNEINKLEQNNRNLKSPKATKDVLTKIEANNKRILELKELSSNLDKEFVRKALKIK